jgi:hypothetical protein
VDPKRHSSQIFDRILLYRDGQIVQLSIEEFFGLPLDSRIRHVIQRTVTFELAGRPVDQKEALAALRLLRATG